jgi:hypothetical protein
MTFTQPSQYGVLPRQYKVLEIAGYTVVAAMQPYPELDPTRPCLNDDAFVGDDESLDTKEAQDYMAAQCDRCSINRACREYGIAHEDYGMWGGTTAQERRAIRRRRMQVLVEPQNSHLFGLNTDHFAFMHVPGWGDEHGKSEAVGA